MNWYRLQKISSIIKTAGWEEVRRYLDEVKKYGPEGVKVPENLEQISPDLKEKLERVKKRQEEGEDVDDNLNDLITDFARRNAFFSNYAWAVPSEEAIQKIQEFVGNEQVLEIGAGAGFWAKLLQEIGVNIKPVDKKLHETYLFQEEYTDVEKLDYKDALKKYLNSNVLMTIWPPYDEEMASDALKNFQGNKLIYVGEPPMGCTADEEFFCILEQEWNLYEKICIPQWKGIHDCLYLYNR